MERKRYTVADLLKETNKHLIPILLEPLDRESSFEKRAAILLSDPNINTASIARQMQQGNEEMAKKDKDTPMLSIFESVKTSDKIQDPEKLSISDIFTSKPRASNMIPEVFDVEKDSFSSAHKTLVICGPPGVGKTRCSLDNFLMPAIKSGVDLDKILSCSYTRAAAGEIRKRLSKNTGEDYDRLKNVCSTIHSFAFSVIKYNLESQRLITEEPIEGDRESEKPKTKKEKTKHGDMIGKFTNWIYRNKNQTKLAKNLINNKELRKILSLWDLARNKLIKDWKSVNFIKFFGDYRKADPGPNNTLIGSGEIQKVQLAIEWYEEFKKENNYLDFSDIIEKAIIHARNKPQEIKELDLLVIDEAQDCTDLQWLLLDEISKKSGKIVILMDPDQAIYSQMGGNPKKIFELINQGAVVRRLAQSYRVCGVIHGLARRVITKNTDRIDSPFEPVGKAGKVDVELSYTDTIKTIKEYDAFRKNIFILGRSYFILQRWVDVLIQEGIPFINERGYSPWGSSELLSVARGICAVQESKDLTIKDALALVSNLPVRNYNYFKQKITRSSVVKQINGWTIGLIPYLQLDKWGVNVIELRSKKLQEIMVDMGFDLRAADFQLVVDVHGSSILNRTPYLRLTTMHSSKGREAELVVVDFSKCTQSARAARLDPEAMNSERRLIYVALTRSLNHTLLSGVTPDEHSRSTESMLNVIGLTKQQVEEDIDTGREKFKDKIEMESESYFDFLYDEDATDEELSDEEFTV